MTERPRIAFARLSLESNALSPMLTTLADFERTHMRSGQELLDACGSDAFEAPGFLKNAELSGLIRAGRQSGTDVEWVPLFSAWTVPGGPLDPEAWLTLRSRLLEELAEAGPLDGVFLSLHGALCVPGVADPEGDLLEGVRAVVGGVPVAVSLDLHANLTPKKVHATSIIGAYRTNPHRDHARVGQRVGELLLRTIAGDVRPVCAWRTLPMVLGGGNNVDFLQPMRPIYRWMRRMERDPHVLYISLFQSQPWLDHTEVGWATHVVTDGDPALAESLADQLADLCWAVRHEQPPQFPSALDAIEQARQARWARRLGTVCMCDASDVVGAGGTGDNTRLLAALIEHASDLHSYVPVRDPVAVAELFESEVGACVSLDVGGRLDPRRNTAVEVSGTLKKLLETDDFGRMAHVQVGHVELVVTEGANLVVRPNFYSRMGLDPWKADVVVVTSLFPFRIFFAAMNRFTIYARTEGITDFDAALREIPWTTPVHPRDEIECWRPADRRRRGTAS
ncbi:MAG: M81 family metallopeptidase [Myxococcota bacterium]